MLLTFSRWSLFMPRHTRIFSRFVGWCVIGGWLVEWLHIPVRSKINDRQYNSLQCLEHLLAPIKFSVSLHEFSKTKFLRIHKLIGYRTYSYKLYFFANVWGFFNNIVHIIATRPKNCFTRFFRNCVGSTVRILEWQSMKQRFLDFSWPRICILQYFILFLSITCSGALF